VKPLSLIAPTALLGLTTLLGCPATPTNNTKTPEVRTVSLSADPLGAQPTLAPPTPFKAVAPEVYRIENGLTVWLVSRPALPIVSMTLTVPAGSADDPKEKPGLAYAAADMLDEGAGSRGAIDISTAMEDLGARLTTGAALDGSNVSLTILKKHLATGFPIFADVIARPRFDAKEYERVNKLWQSRLKRRDDDPEEVARVVRAAVLFGAEAPYGHPTSGRLEIAQTIKLDEVKDFYGKHWRPDRAVLVVAGAITRAELDQLLAKELASWKKPTTAPPARATPSEPLESRPKLVLVDRPDAPQAVIDLVAPGVRANDREAQLLELVNTALGGSFTSRLNQNLREDHHWTYGAGSSFAETRGRGPFVARAAVFIDATAPALREMLAEIAKMQSGGLTEDEFVKGRARDLTDLIQTNEALNKLVSRLAMLAELDLPPDFDSLASQARQASTRPELLALAQKYLDSSKASIVVVGPRKVLEPELRTLGLGVPELWTAAGKPVSGAAKEPDQPKKK
jgi:predicted Zn-dependent peptidase